MIKKQSYINFALILPLLAALLLSCATGKYGQGMRALKSESYGEAIALLQQAESEQPGNAKIKRDLGVALYKDGQVKEAIGKLSEAKSLKADDGKTIFYLGLSYESANQFREAIGEYRHYQSLSRFSRFRNQISARIKQLTLKQVEAEVSRAIAEEQSLEVADIPDNTLAVLYFRNLGTQSRLDPLQKGLAQILITDLARVKNLKVVERMKLQKLLEELEFAESDWVAHESAPRMGRLLGARRILQGGFTDLSEETIRIDASLTETESTQILEVDEITGELNSLFQLQKRLVFQILDELDIEPTNEERESIQKIPTESLLAFLAYSKGLDFEDRGMFDEAEQEYQNAIELDPGFDLVRDSMQELEISQTAAEGSPVDVTTLENQYSTETAPATGPERLSRLQNTSYAVQTGQTPQGDNDTREPLQEGTGSDSVTPLNAIVPIKVPLKE